MGYMKYVLILLVILPTIFSCSVQKRYHRKGYTITWKKNDRVKVNYKRKNTSIEKTASTKKPDVAQRDSIQISSERSESFSSEPEYLVNEQKILSKKELSTSKVNKNSPEKFKFALFSQARKINFKAEISQKAAFHINPSSVSDKKDFERAGRDLGLAGIFFLIGLIIAGIGVLFSIDILAIVAFVFFCIAGLFFFLFIFEGLISLLTFGML